MATKIEWAEAEFAVSNMIDELDRLLTIPFPRGVTKRFEEARAELVWAGKLIEGNVA